MVFSLRRSAWLRLAATALVLVFIASWMPVARCKGRRSIYEHVTDLTSVAHMIPSGSTLSMDNLEKLIPWLHDVAAGDEAHRRLKRRDALSAYEAALAAFDLPKAMAPEIRLSMVHVYLELWMFEKAREVIAAVRSSPASTPRHVARAYHYEGITCSMEGDFDAAEVAYRAAVRTHVLSDSLCAIASISMIRGDVGEWDYFARACLVQRENDLGESIHDDDALIFAANVATPTLSRGSDGAAFWLVSVVERALIPSGSISIVDTTCKRGSESPAAPCSNPESPLFGYGEETFDANMLMLLDDFADPSRFDASLFHFNLGTRLLRVGAETEAAVHFSMASSIDGAHSGVQLGARMIFPRLPPSEGDLHEARRAYPSKIPHGDSTRVERCTIELGQVPDEVRVVQQHAMNAAGDQAILRYISRVLGYACQDLRAPVKLRAVNFMWRQDGSRQIGKRARVGIVLGSPRQYGLEAIVMGLLRALPHDAFTVSMFMWRSAGPAQLVHTINEAVLKRGGHIHNLDELRIDDSRRIIERRNLDVIFFTDVHENTASYFLAFGRMAPVQILLRRDSAAPYGIPDTIDYALADESIVPLNAGKWLDEQLVIAPSLSRSFAWPAYAGPSNVRVDDAPMRSFDGDYFFLPQDTTSSRDFSKRCSLLLTMHWQACFAKTQKV